jgi:hypothetical protein
MRWVFSMGAEHLLKGAIRGAPRAPSAGASERELLRASILHRMGRCDKRFLEGARDPLGGIGAFSRQRAGGAGSTPQTTAPRRGGNPLGGAWGAGRSAIMLYAFRRLCRYGCFLGASPLPTKLPSRRLGSCSSGILVCSGPTWSWSPRKVEVSLPVLLSVFPLVLCFLFPCPAMFVRLKRPESVSGRQGRLSPAYGIYALASAPLP